MSRLLPPAALNLACLLSVLPAAAYGQCVEVVDAKDEPSVERPEVDVRQIVRLTEQGRAALKDYDFGYLEITRPEKRDAGGNIAWMQETFVRLLDKTAGETPFTFSREGAHRIRLFGARGYTWPAPPQLEPGADGNVTLLCGDQPRTVAVDEPKHRPDFPGVRGQWWLAFRLPARPEIGTAVFFKRLGLAAGVDVSIPDLIGDRNDPSNANPYTGTAEIRYRGSRGYIGGGVRYYPEREPDKDMFRPGVFAGEELPTWKGRRLWLLFDVTLQKPEISGLRFGFGARLDLWGSRP
jgi:hypothetical protein